MDVDVFVYTGVFLMFVKDVNCTFFLSILCFAVMHQFCIVLFCNQALFIIYIMYYLLVSYLNSEWNIVFVTA